MVDTSSISDTGQNSLVTPPERSEGGAVFPGENWFFYWKTSSSLWKSKIQEFAGAGRLVIPIHWAFHCTEAEGIDFAQTRPETDLQKLVSQAAEFHREVVFLLPITPAPFLPNGGLPCHLAHGSARDRDQMIFANLDGGGSIHKLYSFFDTKVFQGHAKFVEALGRYLDECQLEVGVWGLDSGYLGKDGFESFLFDRSSIYFQAFVRFLQLEEGSSSTEREKEEFYHQKFFQTIRQVYSRAAADALGKHWRGEIKIAFMGAGLESFKQRISGEENLADSSVEFLRTFCTQAWPSTILLSEDTKGGVLSKLSQDLVVAGSDQVFGDPDFYEGETSQHPRPLKFFEFYHGGWRELGLLEVVERDYGRTYGSWGGRVSDWPENEMGEEGYQKNYFFQGGGLNKQLFQRILRLFMNGQNVILNTAGGVQPWIKKLETFFLENSLPIEKIKWQVEVHQVRLNEGRLILFAGEKFSDLPAQKAVDFWTRLIATLRIVHLSTPCVPGVEIYWRRRFPNGGELDYQEVRRMGVYNVSSYKRKMGLRVPQNFKLLKVVDQIQARVENNFHSMAIELMPGGSVSLDFGVFEVSA